LFDLEQKSDVLIHLIDAYGKVILIENVLLKEGRHTINIQDFPTGMYFLQAIINDKERLVRKVVKQ
ncbi:MAG: Secretion system C-terminal sorting domain, partial [Bacteroidota bacterium]|jgi:hypothetical protein